MLDQQMLSGLFQLQVYDVGTWRVIVGHSHAQDRRSFFFSSLEYKGSTQTRRREQVPVSIL